VVRLLLPGPQKRRTGCTLNLMKRCMRSGPPVVVSVSKRVCEGEQIFGKIILVDNRSKTGAIFFPIPISSFLRFELNGEFMADRKTIASMLLFAGCTLCFFLPFATVSCGGIKVFSLTGQQLATGTTISQPQAFGPAQTQKVASDPFAAIAGFCGIAGVALSLIGRKMAAGTAASGVLGAVSLIVLHSRLEDQIQKQSQGVAQVSFESGYTLALLFLIAGTAWNIYLFLQGRRSVTGAASSPSVDSSSPPCAFCGRPIREGVRFCESCGKPSAS